ncbi:SDR family oxidoreductase [Aestuariivita sp.]|jgi:short-subunit dehydrogenase|uniref:SDR family NAD(P)-dependent oxidoreductase n=1 Tax=Aestuariivita sp. TaxID=1872407 RepID=UPI0021705097|nr:SDR family oxidoreductase [Aestuariivita sp.]MCE8006583.1 SDR family oxidoreductase [Aestuariivita sp.]
MQTWTLITGASTGLGVEFARLAARDGHNLILTARSKDKLDALARDLASDGRDIVVIPADLSRQDEVERLWAEASTDRRIDVLVNNAGLGSHGDFASGQTWAREMQSMTVNMTALAYLMKQAIPQMEAIGKGRILNVASVAGFTPGPNMAVYHATKAFVVSLSEAVAEELRGSPVTVTALCPGPTQTAFFEAADMGGVRLLELGKPMSARKVAEAGWLAARIGKRIVVPGALNKVLAFLPRITPRQLTTIIARKVMGKR